MNKLESYGFAANPFLAEGGVSFTRSESGFDVLNLDYYGETSDPGGFADLHFGVGSLVVGWGFMYVVDVEFSAESGDVYKFSVRAQGLRGSQPVKRTVNTQTQSYTTGPTRIPPNTGPFVAQAQGIYVNYACTFQYVTTVAPNTSLQPQDATPAGTLPTVPSNPFSPAPTNVVYNYPNGWIRENINFEQVYSANIYFVTENWTYYYDYLPG